MEHRPSDHAAGSSPLPHPTEAAAWLSSLAEFLHTRIELIRLESRDVSTFIATKAIATVVAAIAATMAWMCLLVGLIGAAAHFTKLPWWACTLILGALHLLIAFIAAKKIRASPLPLFPVTRGEFAKDKLWLQTLKTPKTK